MGLEWLRERADSFRCRRSKAFNALAEQRLFHRESATHRVVKIRIHGDTPDLKSGTECLLQIVNGALCLVVGGVRPVGIALDPPQDVFDAITHKCHGITAGIIERVSNLSRDADVRLK